jgi:hypothetical protein
MIEVDFIVGFIVCVLSFIAGLAVGCDLGRSKKRGNYEPIEHGNFDESWLHPPPWKDLELEVQKMLQINARLMAEIEKEMRVRLRAAWNKEKPSNVINIIRGPNTK